ncbi:predicted protein [Chaetoceros tenuissimus]|uniref:Uncharacterized protein n=1 Tax=Chaetoceros tenuissimus TaxID=426638 RepID=A0AAD3HDF5_9STRA|nr:predicted protein [Chaetoceros tenuissimus]
MKTTSSTASQILRSRTRNISSQPLSTTITEERNGYGSSIRTTTVRYSNGSEFSSKELLATSNEVLVPLQEVRVHTPLMLSSCDINQGLTSSSPSTVYPERYSFLQVPSYRKSLQAFFAGIASIIAANILLACVTNHDHTEIGIILVYLFSIFSLFCFTFAFLDMYSALLSFKYNQDKNSMNNYDSVNFGDIWKEVMAEGASCMLGVSWLIFCLGFVTAATTLILGVFTNKAVIGLICLMTMWLSVAYALMCHQAESSRLGPKGKKSNNPDEYVDESIHSFFVAVRNGILSVVFLVVENTMIDGDWYENPVRVVLVMMTVGFGVASFIHYTIAFTLIRLAKADSDEMRKTKKEKDGYIVRPSSLFVFATFLQILGLITFVVTLIMASIDEPINPRFVLFLIFWHSVTWWLLMLEHEPSLKRTSSCHVCFDYVETDNMKYKMIGVEHDIESQETLTYDPIGQEPSQDLTENSSNDSSTQDLNTVDTIEANRITSNTTYEPPVLGSNEE